MKIVIEGKNIHLTQPLKDYVNEKLSKLEKHYDHLIKGHDVKVKLSIEKNPRVTNNNITEVTIFLDGKIIRSEQTSEDMYASIDLVVDKLDRQIQKYKSKVYRSYQHNERPKPNPQIADILIEERNTNTEKEKPRIIKTKNFKLHPMTPEEATIHLDLIEHDFYIFVNSLTNQINTVYKRKDGSYGLIEPVI